MKKIAIRSQLWLREWSGKAGKKGVKYTIVAVIL
jgi:hypothetical protein